MKQKILWVLTIVLAVSMIGSVAAYAALEQAPLNAEIPKDSMRRAAPRHKMISVGEKQNMKLTYEKTVYIEPTKYQDCYTDDSNIEYYFDEKGDFVCMFPPFETDAEKIQEQQSNDPIGEEAALKVADQVVKDTLGDKAATLGKGKLSRNNQLTYYFSYSQKYGKSDWITGEEVMVAINRDGSFNGCVFLNLNDFENFDFTKLDTVSKETVENELVAQAKAVYGADFQDCEPTEYQLVNQNGAYYIEARGEVTFGAEGLKDLMNYYYAVA